MKEILQKKPYNIRTILRKVRTGKANFPAIGITIFTIYAFTQRLFDLYSHVRIVDITFIRVVELFIVTIALMFIIISSFAISTLSNNITKRITPLDLFWLPATISIIFYILTRSGNMYELFFYITGFAFLIIAKVDIYDYRTSFSFIKYGALVYGAASIVQFFFTTSFNSFIVRFTEKYSIEDINIRVQRNYYPGLGYNRTALAANYISAGLGVILSMWDDKNIRGLFYNLTLFLFLFAALLITGKRSLLLWTLVALPITYIVLGQSHETLKRIVKVIAYVCSAALLIMLISSIFEMPALFLRVESMIKDIMAGEVTSSLGVRFNLYKDAWAIFIDNPIFGIGWDQFRVIHPADDLVHNVFLQLLAETGILGFSLILSPLIYSYIRTYQAVKSSLKHEGSVGSLWSKGLAYSFYYQTVFLLYCISDNAFYGPVYIMLYFLALSITNSFLIYEKTEHNLGVGKT